MTQVDAVGNPEYTYVQAANAIAARIEAGEITHRLPAERDLARELRGRGMIITRQGRGTFVTALASRDDSSNGR
jgi:DNA-binding GntR family transcriptional regulator